MEVRDISLDEIRDRVVSANTLKTYLSDNFYFLFWLLDNRPDCLTEHGIELFTDFRASCPNDATTRTIYRRFKDVYAQSLREAESIPILRLDVLTPLIYMDHIRLVRNLRTNTFLSRSAYGNRRAGLYHLYRLHNNIGFDPNFSNELTHLFRGFFSSLTGMVGRMIDADADDVEVDLNNDAANVDADNVIDVAAAIGDNRRRRATNEFKTWRWGSDESKKPMSVELLKSICGWLLDRGTPDGVWSQCYLLMAWNLCCRSNNVAYLKMSDISWSSSFDAFCVYFAHSKTDQTGKESKYARHIYANPHCPKVCPVTALASYFSTNFNIEKVDECSLLFPGGKDQKSNQEQRFAKNLFGVLLDHEAEVNALGFDIKQIGSHSIRKGAATYLTSLVGGPPAAAISIRGGWSMGNVKERYFKYMEAGDQYVGRCLSLLPMLSEEMAASPPYFDVDANTTDDVWVTDNVRQQFEVCCLIVGFGRLCRMLAASILYHREWFRRNLNPNHCIRICSHLLRSEVVDNFINTEREEKGYIIKVTYPWNDRLHVFTGIPPHVALLNDLRLIRSDQQRLIDTFVDKVKEALSDYGVNNDRHGEDRIRIILDQFNETMQQRLQMHGRAAGEEIAGVDIEANERAETEKTVYKPHYYDGMWHRVPKDWRIPRCGVKDLWRQWWVGNTKEHIPPLRIIKNIDIKHINDIPLSPEEMHRRTGRYAGQRRRQSKQLSDMNFLMRILTQFVKDSGKFEEKITLSSTERMYAIVSEELNKKNRDLQKMWGTVAKDLRLRRYNFQYERS